MMNAATTEKRPTHLAFVDPASAPLAESVQYVLDRFHVFQHAEMGRLPALFRKVAAVRPELAEAYRIFEDLCAELTSHFGKEEHILLPYISSLDPSRGRGSFRAPFGSIEGPVHVMQMEHDAAKEAMERVEQLTANLAVPAGATPEHATLFADVRVFFDDVNQHIAYEDILFPRAIDVENS